MYCLKGSTLRVNLRFLLQGTSEIDRVNGVNAAELTKKIQNYAGTGGAGPSATSAAPAEVYSLLFCTLLF